MLHRSVGDSLTKHNLADACDLMVLSAENLLKCEYGSDFAIFPAFITITLFEKIHLLSQISDYNCKVLIT